MGASLSYLVIRGKSKEKIWEDLGLKLSHAENRSASPSNDITGILIKNGEYLICDYSWKVFENEKKLSKLSTNAELLTGAVEEHVNYSVASGWSAGKVSWTVSHDLNKGDNNLEVFGTPPPSFAKVKRAVLEARNRAIFPSDFFFSIPVDLFKALTGFCYDGTGSIHEFEPACEFLERILDKHKVVEAMPMEELYNVLSRLSCIVHLEKDGQIEVSRRGHERVRLGPYRKGIVSAITIEQVMLKLGISIDDWHNQTQ